MTSLRIFLAVAAACLTGLILWAATQSAIGASFGRIIADPWGIVMLGDLYLGFACIAIIIAIAEGSTVLGLAWFAALCVVGNVGAALWLVWRLPRIAAAFSRSP